MGQNPTLKYNTVSVISKRNELVLNLWLLLLLISLISFATYAISRVRFRYTLYVNKSRKYLHRNIPVVPYWIPFLGHAIPMALNSGAFISKVMLVFKISWKIIWLQTKTIQEKVRHRRSHSHTGWHVKTHTCRQPWACSGHLQELENAFKQACHNFCT